MDAEILLSDLRTRGMMVTADGDKLLVSPRDLLTDTDRERIRQHKGSLLRAVAAESERDKALAVIDAALSAAWLSTAQRKLLAVFRQQVRDYHARRDPLLFGAPTWIGQYVERWRRDFAAFAAATKRRAVSAAG